jgi:uncharacterized protein (TIGR00251 family)
MPGRIVSVKVITNSHRPGIEVDDSGRFKVRVSQPPADGKANAAVLELLARYFKVKRSSLEIIKGATSRHKDILLRNS